MSVLLTELKKFSRENWWVYIIFVVAFLAAVLTHAGNPTEILSIFTAHFIGDLFYMAMAYEYGRKNYAVGGVYQLFGMVIFFGIGLDSGLNAGTWHYLIPNLVFTPVAIKNYLQDAKGVNISWLNEKVAIAANFFIVALIYLPYEMIHGAQWIQVFGFAAFSSSLAFNNKSKKSFYLMALIGVSAIALGTSLEFFRGLEEGHVWGIMISNILFPLTVVIVFTKQWPEYFSKKVEETIGAE